MKHEFKPADLRIGDVATYHSPDLGNMTCSLDWQDLQELSIDPELFSEFHSPIQLTVQVFNKIGFSSRVNQGVTEAFKPDFRYSFVKPKDSDKWLFCDGKTVINTLEFLHELQQLYALLTKTELDVSNLINQ